MCPVCGLWRQERKGKRNGNRGRERGTEGLVKGRWMGTRPFTLCTILMVSKGTKKIIFSYHSFCAVCLFFLLKRWKDGYGQQWIKWDSIVHQHIDRWHTDMNEHSLPRVCPPAHHDKIKCTTHTTLERVLLMCLVVFFVCLLASVSSCACFASCGNFHFLSCVVLVDHGWWACT